LPGFAACLDIGGEYAGSVVAAMNTAAQIGSLVSSVAFGFLVDRYGSYDLPFIPMAVLLVIGAWLWLKINPTRLLIPKLAPGTPAGTPTDAALAGIGPP
jgi:predicted MFS family arabinose efflux permease